MHKVVQQATTQSRQPAAPRQREAGTGALADTLHASPRQTAQRQLAQSIQPAVQRQPVIQCRATAAVYVDAAALRATVAAIADLADDETAANILTRDALLAGHRATRNALAAEILEKSTAHGRPVGTEAAINIRLGQIPGEIATATADVTAGTQPAPPKPASAWGAGGGAYRVWESKNAKVAENQQKILDLNAEHATKTADIPIAQLIDARNAVDTKLASLAANLLRVKRERYEYDLLTTVAPTCKSFTAEGMTVGGDSTLGIFVYAMPAQLNGIDRCIDPFEIHGHYQAGSKRLRRAHFRGGKSANVVLYSGPAIDVGSIGNAYNRAVMVLCNASIP